MQSAKFHIFAVLVQNIVYCLQLLSKIHQIWKIGISAIATENIKISRIIIIFKFPEFWQQNCWNFREWISKNSEKVRKQLEARTKSVQTWRNIFCVMHSAEFQGDSFCSSTTPKCFVKEMQWNIMNVDPHSAKRGAWNQFSNHD